MSDSASPQPPSAPASNPPPASASAPTPPSPAAPASAAPAASEHPELDGFKLVQELSKTPRGATYKARRQVEQDIVAVKILRAAACDKKFLDGLPSRAESTFFLEHANIVKCLGVNAVNGRTVLVMSYAPGLPLNRALKKNGRFQPSQALIVILQCVTALRYAAQHKRHHSRLHPADIILGEDHARLLGVGLGERPEHPPWDPTRAPQLFEPLIYAAPEAMPSKSALEKPEALAAADVYSLGAILYHMLTGMPPFHGADETALNSERDRLGMPVAWPRQVAKILPGEVVNLIEKMLSPDPASRPTYEQLVPSLTVLIPIAEQSEALRKSSDKAIAKAANAATHASSAATQDLPVLAPAAAPGRAQLVSRQNGSVSVLDFPTARGGAAPQNYRGIKGARAERFFTMVLVGLTVIVFLFAASLAVDRFVYQPVRQTAAPAQPARIAPHDVAVVTAPVSPVESTGTTTDTRSIAAAGPTSAAVSAQPNVINPGNSGSPITNANQTAQNGPQNANDDYAAAARQVDKIEEMMKDGSIKPSAPLLRLVQGLVNKAGPDTTVGIKALLLQAQIENAVVRKYYGPQSATTNPANVPNAAEQPQPLPPQANPPIPTPADSAKNDAAEKAAQLDKQVHAYDLKIQTIMSAARKFQYATAKPDMTELAAKAEGEGKKSVAAATELFKQESELFGRCRTYLKAYIDKHPQHSSKIQVFPRKDDPVGYDILDIDSKGLTILTKKDKQETTHVREWKNVSASNAFNMLQLLADKKNLEDQIGLAAFALNHGLKEKYTATLSAARDLPGGAERCTAFTQHADLIVTLLKDE